MAQNAPEAQQQDQNAYAFQVRKQTTGLIDNMRSEVAKALPDHAKVDRFLRITRTVVMNNPKLMECDRDSLRKAIMDCASLGLEPDPAIGHADILPRWDGRARVNRAEMQVRYGGYLELTRRSGQVRDILCEIVHENDKFQRGVRRNELFVDWEPAADDARGDWIGVLTVLSLTDGTTKSDYMSKSDILDIRDSSSEGWKAYQNGKIKTTPWATNEKEMARKTAIRRARKYWPLSIDDQRRLAVAEAIEHSTDGGKQVEFQGGTVMEPGANPQQTAPARPGAPNQLEAFRAKHGAAPEPAHDPETGEIGEPVEATPCPPNQPAPGPAPQAASPTPPAGRNTSLSVPAPVYDQDGTKVGTYADRPAYVAALQDVLRRSEVPELIVQANHETAAAIDSALPDWMSNQVKALAEAAESDGQAGLGV